MLDGEPRAGREDLGDLRRERGRRDDHRVGRAVGDDLAFGHHHDAVRARRDELHVVGRHDDRVTVGREVAEDARELAFGAVVEAAGRFVEQDDARRRRELHREHQREPLPFGEIARMRAGVDARREPIERDARAAGLGARLGVGLRELFGDGVEVEQVGRRLRHEADERARLGGREVSGVAAADVDPAALARAGALERPQQRRLAGAVAAHERDDLAGAQLEVDVAHGDDRSVAHDDPARVERRGPGRDRPRHCGRRISRREPGEEWLRAAARVAHRQRQRRPTREAAELDDRRRDARAREQLGRIAVLDGAVAGNVHDRVGVLHDAFEPVLGHHDGDAEVVHEPRDRREHLFGARSGRARRWARRARAPWGAR